tara:strand:- start:13033 stop:13305 length:273 start_codon:yes stop_codon:yes gene_type:complete
MNVTIHGKRWRIRFCKFEDASQLGECDSPDTPRKEIRIRDDLRSEEKLRILIHELRHAADWGQSEQYICDESNAIAACLWKLGLRWQNEE